MFGGQEARKAQLENHEPEDEEEELDLEKDLQDSGNTSPFILYTCVCSVQSPLRFKTRSHQEQLKNDNTTATPTTHFQ